MKIARKLIKHFLQRRQGIYRLRHLGIPSDINWSVQLVYPERIEIGRFVRIGERCHLDGEGGLSIGPGSVLSPRVTILTSSHVYDQTEYLPYNNDDMFKPVTIGRGVWVCWGASIAPGVTIGDGAIVAMKAVVTRDVLPGSVVGGNPACPIKQRDMKWIAEAIEIEQYYQKIRLCYGLKRRE